MTLSKQRDQPWPSNPTSGAVPDLSQRALPLNRKSWEHWLVVVWLGLGVFTYLWPKNSAKLFNSVASDPGDPLFTLSILKWAASCLPSLEGFWHAPFFFPETWSTARSDHLLGPAVWMKLTDQIGGSVLSFNILFLGSFLLSGFATYWVLRRRFSAPAAALAGFWFAFSPYRMSTLSHIQVLLAQWVPLTLWAFDRLLEKPSARRGVLFLAFYALHVSGGAYLAFMIHVALAVILIVRWRESIAALRIPTKGIVVAIVGTLAVAMMATLYVPYLQAERAGVTSARGMDQLRHTEIATSSFLNAHARYRWADIWPSQLRRGHSRLFPGLVALVLAGLGAASLIKIDFIGWRKLPLWTRGATWFGVGSCFVGALLADAYTLTTWPRFLGISLARGYLRPFQFLIVGILIVGSVWWRSDFRPLRLRMGDKWTRGWLWIGAVSVFFILPVFYFYTLGRLPGFSGMRVISRFNVFVSLAIALLIAAGVEVLRSRSTRVKTVVVLCGAILFMELLPQNRRWVFVGTESDLAPAYQALRDRDDVRGVVELPFRIGHGSEARRMYQQTFHRKPLVNGHSGSLPRGYFQLTEICKGFLPKEPECLDRLRSMGVNYVVSEPERRHRNVRVDLRGFGERSDVEVVTTGRRWLFRLRESENLVKP